jgi:hypothetical protein
MEVQLPDGFKTDSGIVYDKAKIGEITGRQQNYLMDLKGLKSGLSHIDKLLTDLVQGFFTQDGSQYQGSLVSALHKISISDIETLLVKIRENTYGNVYYMNSRCTHCDAENKQKLDLSSLAITPSEVADKEKKVEITLPRSGKKAELKLMGLDSLHKSWKIFEKNQSELMTATASLALKSLDGKVDPTSEDLKSLPVMDIKYINDEYSKIGGKMDTTITHECKECGKDFDTRLNVVDPNFFSLTSAFSQENS